MDRSRFSDESPGNFVRIGLEGAEFAFVPDPLPPTWEWPNHLWPLLADAKAALAHLDGIGVALPEPEILLRPLELREAQTSSRLEGTIAPEHEVLLLELESSAATPQTDTANAAREIHNYARALRLLGDPDTPPLSLRLIRLFHGTLLKGVRGQDRTPGEFRRIVVQIGKPARFVPPPPNELTPALDAFEKYLHGEHRFDPLVEAFMVHYQFEAIHPFLDGNGRVGRLLLAMNIADWCKLSKPWLHMSPYFESQKDLYFDRLFDVSATRDWTSWIEFCLRGVISQAQDAARRCRRLLELRASFQEKLGGSKGSVRLLKVSNRLFAYPVVTVVGHSKDCRITFPTAKADLEKLTKLGVLRRLKPAERLTYYAPDVIKVIYE